MFKLFINENIKVLKKKSTMILIGLSILSLFACVGLVKFVEYVADNMNEIIGDNIDWQEELKLENEELKKELEKNTDSVAKANIKAQLEKNELALKNNVDIYYGYDYWKIDVLDEIVSKKSELYTMENEKEKDEYKKLESEINELIVTLENSDYNKYLDTKLKDKKQELEQKNITKEEYDEAEYITNLMKKYEIGKEEDGEYWKENIIEEIRLIKSNIRTGINQTTGKIATQKQIEEMEEVLKLDLYRLENNIPVASETDNYSTIYGQLSSGMTVFFIAIFGIIVAGSSISTEISKGTIKFWAMLPAKRWKILLSKLLTAIILTIIFTIILSVLGYVVENIFFEKPADPYLYIINGEVKVLEGLTYNILYYLTYDIDIIIYILFATMLSVLSRNTAVAVGISTALYTGSGLVMQILNAFITADWIKFIPFNNMNLTSKIFTNSVSYMQIQEMSSFTNNTSLVFSLCVLGVCGILMLITMFDSFNKKDIL